MIENCVCDNMKNEIKTPFGNYKIGEKVWYWVYDIGKKPGIITEEGVKADGLYAQYCKDNNIDLIAKYFEIDKIIKRSE